MESVIVLCHKSLFLPVYQIRFSVNSIPGTVLLGSIDLPKKQEV